VWPWQVGIEALFMNVKTDMSKSQNKTSTTHKIIIGYCIADIKNNPFFLRHTSTKKKLKEKRSRG